MSRPLLSILACAEEELTLAVVAGEEKEESLLRIVMDLRIGHDVLVDVLERSDVIWLVAAETYTVTLVSSSGNKDPDVSVLVDLDSRIIVRVIHTVLALVKHQTWLLKHTGVMVIAADHALKVTLAILRCSAIDKESLVDFFCVCRHRDMLHCVSSESSGVLVTILLHLTQSKPDAAVTIHCLILMWQ